MHSDKVDLKVWKSSDMSEPPPASDKKLKRDKYENLEDDPKEFK